MLGHRETGESITTPDVWVWEVPRMAIFTEVNNWNIASFRKLFGF
jgi:hypothetical protein